MAQPIKDNKHAIQSYIFTTARYDFSVYEKRIIYRLVEAAQDELQGIMIRDHLHKIEPSQFGRKITMPVSDILRDEKDENYTIAKKAFRTLSNKGFEYEDDEVWMYTPIITAPRIAKKKGYVEFQVCDDIWKAMLDFTKGYRKMELLTAMRFNSVYAMRFYELMSGQSRPIYFELEDLKKRFGVENKYKLTANFKKKVLDIAKAELDKSSPYSFNYLEVKEGRAIVGFKFFPTWRPDNQDPKLVQASLQSKVTARLQMSNEVYELLRYSFEFDVAEINKNKKTIIDGESNIPDFYGFLHSLIGPSRTANNRQGYVINAIKKQTAECKR